MHILHFLDLFGTLVFAISGAFRAVKYELDLLGVAVLAVVTGLGGGILRDLLLDRPPCALVEQTYVLLCLVGAGLVVLLAPKIATRWDYVMASDAVGLSVFTALGAATAAAQHAAPLAIILLAMLTACGGGVIRDLLVTEIPAVLKSDFYATAALLGGACYVLLGQAQLGAGPHLAGTIGFTLAWRCLAMKYRLHLPRVKSLPASPSQLTHQRRTQPPR